MMVMATIKRRGGGWWYRLGILTEGPIGNETRTDDPGSDKGVLSHMDTILHYDDNDDGDGDDDDDKIR